ncbi:hypothetical protein ABPG75_000318 [Micractinium tetrahymenae]
MAAAEHEGQAAFYRLLAIALQTAQLGQLDVGACAAFLAAAAELHAPLTPEQQEAWEQQAAARLSVGVPPALVAVLSAALRTACSVSRRPPSSGMAAALERAVVEPRLLRALPGMDATGFAGALCTLGFASWRPTARLEMAMRFKLLRVLPTTGPQEAASILRCWDQLGWPLSSRLRAKAEARAAGRHGAAEQQESGRAAA